MAVSLLKQERLNKIKARSRGLPCSAVEQLLPNYSYVTVEFNTFKNNNW